ncbi:hypothetical protein [Paenibacillus sp. J22TS3]|nr:hypothetical protein [Paenibacillus sp. J22TS3]GIP21282.1 hypothetical protein J22TS3_15570 [Paenibacillus sp. J22TS3]
MEEHGQYYLSPKRQWSDTEQELIWKKTVSHKTSEEELRISKEVKK